MTRSPDGPGAHSLLQAHDSDDATKLFAELERFAASKLSGVLRRLAAWKQLDRRPVDGVCEDVRQDLVVDILEHGAEIANLSAELRERRWMRLAQRSVYRELLRADGRHAAIEFDATRDGCTLEPAAACESSALEDLPRSERSFAVELLDRAVRLEDGRLAAEPTAKQLQIGVRRLRHGWSQCAERLGFGLAHRRFWIARLVEALLTAAAGRLLDAGNLSLWQPERHRRPHPTDVTHRLRRIRQMLEVTPLDRTLRHTFAATIAPGCAPPNAACYLELAAALAPHDVRITLWQFEEAVGRGALRAAERALDACPSTPDSAPRLLLARARLDELHGSPLRATRRLQHGLRIHRSDPRLLLSLDRLLDASRRERQPAAHTARRRQAPSARRIASSASRSKPA